MCELLGISWSDTLLETTGAVSVYSVNGECTTGFDLKPVYRTYDEYFDAFDKFRLDLIFREKNKAYGYSYIDKDKYPYSIEELGSLFEIPFRFEKYVMFKNEEDKKRFRYKMRLLCTALLYMEDKKELYKEHFHFGAYLQADS